MLALINNWSDDEIVSNEMSEIVAFCKRFSDFLTTNPYITVHVKKGMETLIDIQLSYTTEIQNNCLAYKVCCLSEGVNVISFEIMCSIHGETYCIDFGNVYESEGFYLFSVKLGRIVVLPANDAKIAIPTGAGRLLPVADMECFEFAYQIDSQNPLLMGCVYNNKSFCVLETDSYENKFYCEVFTDDSEKYGGFSVEIIHRLAEFELIEYNHMVPAASPEFFLNVQNSCRVTLTFGVSNDTVTWQDAAGIVRDKQVGALKDYYSDKIIGKILADNGTGKDRATLKEIGEVIKKYAALTNNQPAVFYLVGWQYNGHDTGYPAIEELNKNIGSMDDWKVLTETAREHNVNISFHDNYDDAYQNSPDWDQDIISLDASGNMMKCGFFVQGQAYLISNYKYEKYVPKRVAKTIELYGIEKSYHIDVLSGAYKAGRRYDFNPKSPAAAKKNLEGKYMVIDEFKKYGVDVTTEDFSSIFPGRVSHFWHMGSEDKNFSDDTHIPLIPFIYHSLISWGSHGASKKEVCRALLHGACYSADITHSNFDECIDMYCLVSMPWMALYGKKMISCEKDGSTERVIYEDGSVVDVNFASETYCVTVNDEIIAKDFTTFVLQTTGVYLAYSRYGGTFSYKIPASLKGDNMKLCKLLPDNDTENIDFSVTEGLLQFTAEAAVPYRLTV